MAIHLSNLRPVKRISDLLEIISKVKENKGYSTLGQAPESNPRSKPRGSEPFFALLGSEMKKSTFSPHSHYVGNKKIKLLILAGADFSPFQSMVAKWGIADRIIIKRDVLDIENYINASDVGIYTSFHESFGMGILETMSYGKPVLATDVGGISEVMQDGKTGYLFGLGKVDDFAAKLLELASDETLTEKLGEQAKERARSNFCSEKIVAQYEEYYRKIIESNCKE
ncbi:MAG: glycosyltransferase [Candidatus Pacebacteria bacterium]|nr:glycosyltransferase [Candidatus Paceibacterota bacterium]